MLLVVGLRAANSLPAQAAPTPTASPSAAAAAQSPQQIATTEKLNQLVKGVQFKGTPLAEVLEKISQAGGVKIVLVEKDRVRSGRCDIFLENVPLKALLAKALSQNRLDHRIEKDGTISIIRKSGPIEWSNNETAGHDIGDLTNRMQALEAGAAKLRSMTEAEKNSRVYVDEFILFMQERGEVYALPSMTGEAIPASLDVAPPRQEALDDWMKGQSEKIEAARAAEYKAFEERMAREEEERRKAAAEKNPQAESGDAATQPPSDPATQSTPLDPSKPIIRGKIIDGQK